MAFTIGSLFDGSGGFPLAAAMCGGTPVWASEVEPYPIAVTKTRFPKMKHLGSVTDIKGNEVEPVDVITFGSPCQDLSVAGKRAGLKHTDNGDEETTRSGLFMEAVRIIKEMREATNGEYPRFAVWENVPGAFSSNKGEDFRIVLEELIKIVEPTAVMPEVPKNGWPYADSYCGDGWSIAYRVLDAQFWGVPQRRRRIYLVLNLGGERAGEISFEREGLRWYFETGRTPWQTATGDAEGGSGTADCERVGINGEVAATLDASYYKGCGMRQGVEREVVAVPYTLKIRSGCEGGGNVPMVMEPFTFDARGNGDGKTVSTITGCHEASVSDFTSVVGMPIQDAPVYCPQGNGIDRADTAGCNGKGVKEDVCYTLNTIDRPAVAYSLETFHCTSEEEKTTTLKARDYKDPICVAIDRAAFNQGQNAQYTPQYYEDGTNPTLVARGPSAVAYGVDCRNATEYEESNGALQAACNHNHNSNNVVRVQYIVRRLTPTECARLQGFPDRWATPDKKTEFTDEEYRFWLNVRNTHAEINGKATKEYTKDQMLTWYNKLHTDSAEYKLWGNGIALPCALYVMQGIAEVFTNERN